MLHLYWIGALLIRCDPQLLIHLFIYPCKYLVDKSLQPPMQPFADSFIYLSDAFACSLRASAVFADIHPSIYLFIFSLVHCSFVSACVSACSRHPLIYLFIYLMRWLALFEYPLSLRTFILPFIHNVLLFFQLL